MPNPTGQPAYHARELGVPVSRGLSSLPVVVVSGMRQAGKSAFILHDPAFRDRRYLTLDDPSALALAKDEPAALLSGSERLSIDEVQRMPSLLVAIKRAIDLDRVPGRYLLTASADLALMEGVTESLAGRAIYFEMPPMSRREIRGETSTPPFLLSLFDDPACARPAVPPPISTDELRRGGLPPVALDLQVDPETWFRGYEQTYLERDVRALSNIPDLVPFRRLARLAALRSGQIMNQAALARDAALPPVTAGRYLDLLSLSYIIRRLPPYLANATSRIVKSPKTHVSDSGLFCHLTGTDADPLSGDSGRGALLETYVLQNLKAILQGHRPGIEICYWHVQGRHEVDFVLANRRAALGIEVKASAVVRSDDFASLKAFLASNPEARGGIVAYSGTECIRFGDRLFAVPLSLLLA